MFAVPRPQRWYGAHRTERWCGSRIVSDEQAMKFPLDDHRLRSSDDIVTAVEETFGQGSSDRRQVNKVAEYWVIGGIHDTLKAALCRHCVLGHRGNTRHTQSRTVHWVIGGIHDTLKAALFIGSSGEYTTHSKPHCVLGHWGNTRHTQSRTVFWVIGGIHDTLKAALCIGSSGEYTTHSKPHCVLGHRGNTRHTQSRTVLGHRRNTRHTQSSTVYYVIGGIHDTLKAALYRPNKNVYCKPIDRMCFVLHGCFYYLSYKQTNCKKCLNHLRFVNNICTVN